MTKHQPESPMRIRLSDERRADLIRALKEHFADHFDEVLSDFRAEGLLDFFVRELGPPVYNQGVRDASSYMQEKLSDIEGEVYRERARIVLGPRPSSRVNSPQSIVLCPGSFVPQDVTEDGTTEDRDQGR